MMEEPKKREPLNSFFKYSGFAIQMSAGILFAAWLGYLIDKKLNTSPLFLLLFIMVSFFGFIYQLWNELTGNK